MVRFYLYDISSDGKTTTTQWLTEEEAKEHEELGYIVKRRDHLLHYMEL